MKTNDNFLFLVRHAQTRPDPQVPAEHWKLAAAAGEECRRLAAKLAPLRPDRVITSEHHKAIATGGQLAESLGLPCETAEGLAEHDRTGVAFVDDPDEWLAMLARVFERPDEVVLGTESAARALERFDESLRRVVSRHPEERLVVVSHATVMALLIGRYNDVEAFDFWKTIEMPEALVLDLPDFGLRDRLTAGGASNEDFNRR